MKKTIIAMFVLFLAVIGIVLVTNKEQLQKKLGLGEAEQTAQMMTTENMSSNGGQIGNDLSAFMQDETFFDPEDKIQRIEAYAGKKVSMVMSSVAKDLRILIVDSVGELVKDYPFTVTIEGVGEYTDHDEDGMIYIDSLRAGEYFVSLKEAEGFRVSDEVTTIKVRQEIEYRVLSDIEYMMLTEDQVDAEKEDKAVNEAEDDADETEKTDLLASGSAKLGIDVSKWNEDIEWDKVKDSGVEFAIIRCGYRGASTGALVIDPKYKQNIEGAIEAGIPVGVYFFTQAVDEVEAVEEASMVIRLIEEYDVDYPVFLDSESAGGSGRADDLEATDRTKIHKAFLKTIAAAGYETGVYASKNWLNNRLETDKLADYRTWLAEYTEVPTYSDYYHMWQYTSKGAIDGISTKVDLNLSYMNIDISIDHSKGAGGYTGIVNGDSGNVPVSE